MRSLGRPTRPNTVFAPSLSRNVSSLTLLDDSPEVFGNAPGRMALHRTLYRPQTDATYLVRPKIAAFDIE